MRSTTLGGSNHAVSRIGYGAMHLSISGRPDEAQAQAVIHHALDRGVRLIDSADAYCLDEGDKHHNECLVARALASWPGDRDAVVVATKGGLVRPDGHWEPEGGADHLRSTIRDSHRLLGSDGPIRLWQHHAPDPDVPLGESLDAIREAVDAGLIEHVGVSNYSVEQIEQARERLPVVSVQNQYSPWHRKPEQDGVLAYCEREGLTFLPWSPMGGRSRATKLDDHPAIADAAAAHGCSPQRVVLAWLQAKSPCILPIPGTTSTAHLDDLLAADDLQLSDEERAAIDAAGS